MKININKAANILSVTLMTLRRWDSQGVLKARRDSPTAHRYYQSDGIEDFLADNFKYLRNSAVRWTFSQDTDEGIILPRFYCEDSSIFKARLTKLEKELQRDPKLQDNFSLVTSIVGEIGNNSFDHNIGNWPGTPGIFFGYNLKTKKIILSDKGRGVLATLKKAKSDLKNDEEALKVAFTEVISGRSPESRGNGLKYVKKLIIKYSMNLEFQSGNGLAEINGDLDISNAKDNLNGCFAILDYKNL